MIGECCVVLCVFTSAKFADSESIYDEVIQEIVGQYGKVYSLDVRLKVLGTPEPETARIIIEELQLPLTVEEFIKVYKPLCEKELGNPVILPGKNEMNLISREMCVWTRSTFKSEDRSAITRKQLEKW